MLIHCASSLVITDVFGDTSCQLSKLQTGHFCPPWAHIFLHELELHAHIIWFCCLVSFASGAARERNPNLAFHPNSAVLVPLFIPVISAIKKISFHQRIIDFIILLNNLFVVLLFLSCFLFLVFFNYFLPSAFLRIFFPLSSWAQCLVHYIWAQKLSKCIHFSSSTVITSHKFWNKVALLDLITLPD